MFTRSTSPVATTSPAIAASSSSLCPPSATVRSSTAAARKPSTPVDPIASRVAHDLEEHDRALGVDGLGQPRELIVERRREGATGGEHERLQDDHRQAAGGASALILDVVECRVGGIPVAERPVRAGDDAVAQL